MLPRSNGPFASRAHSSAGCWRVAEAWPGAPDGPGLLATEGGAMHITRSTPVALAIIALAAGIGGAQTPTAQAPAQQGDPSAVYKKLSMFVYPAKGQSPEKQKKDEK